MCKDINAKLAEFETKPEQDFVLKNFPLGFVKRQFTEIYIGGVKKPDNWYWASSDVPINYNLSWIPGEPNNWGGNEDCLSISRYYLNGNAINDATCNYYIGSFLCEIDNTTPIENFVKIGEFRNFEFFI